MTRWMQSKLYKGNSIFMTSTTTEVMRDCGGYLYGKRYRSIEHLFGIEGPQGKQAMKRPFLTSQRQCIEYINGRIEESELRKTIDPEIMWPFSGAAQ